MEKRKKLVKLIKGFKYINFNNMSFVAHLAQEMIHSAQEMISNYT